MNFEWLVIRLEKGLTKIASHPDEASRKEALVDLVMEIRERFVHDMNQMLSRIKGEMGRAIEFEREEVPRDIHFPP